MMGAASKSGGCLCGGVRYRIESELGGLVYCFCGQCRKTSGHHAAATRVPRRALHLEKDGTLKWYRSSEKARRGFCRNCGGNLFWQHDEQEVISIMAGAIDPPTGLRLRETLYTGDASDYQTVPEPE